MSTEQKVYMCTVNCIFHAHSVHAHMHKRQPVIVLMSGLASGSCNHGACVLSALSEPERREDRSKRKAKD